jgi:hypothetical protein
MNQQNTETQEYPFLLTEIDWDTYDEETGEQDSKGLPYKMLVWALDEDDALDTASDEIGWCIDSCYIAQIDPADLQEHASKTDEKILDLLSSLDAEVGPKPHIEAAEKQSPL